MEELQNKIEKFQSLRNEMGYKCDEDNDEFKSVKYGAELEQQRNSLMQLLKDIESIFHDLRNSNINDQTSRQLKVAQNGFNKMQEGYEEDMAKCQDIIHYIKVNKPKG